MAFNVACVSRQDQVQGFQVLSTKLLSVCSSILHLETLRNSTPESLAFNVPFIQVCEIKQSHTYTILIFTVLQNVTYTSFYSY